MLPLGMLWHLLENFLPTAVGRRPSKSAREDDTVERTMIEARGVTVDSVPWWNELLLVLPPSIPRPSKKRAKTMRDVIILRRLLPNTADVEILQQESSHHDHCTSAMDTENRIDLVKFFRAFYHAKGALRIWYISTIFAFGLGAVIGLVGLDCLVPRCQFAHDW